MAENIKSGKYYRVFNGTDWDRMHFVTDASSVLTNDGKTVEEKVGAIKGITTSTDVTEEGYAADATVVASLTESLVASDNLKFQFATDGEGNYGYLGADDSFIPFKSADLSLVAKANNNTYTTELSYQYTGEDIKLGILIAADVRDGLTYVNITCDTGTLEELDFINMTYGYHASSRGNIKICKISNLSSGTTINVVTGAAGIYLRLLKIL